MSAPVLPPLSNDLATMIPGVWWLQSREDWTKEGQRRIDPVLGSDPIAILTYTSTHFAAQFMKRDRSLESALPVFQPGENNTSAAGGYDAYFGTYKVDTQTGKVAHTLIGAITLTNIGMTVSRDLRVENNTLTIQLETTTTQGEPVTRTLTWKRMS